MLTYGGIEAVKTFFHVLSVTVGEMMLAPAGSACERG